MSLRPVPLNRSLGRFHAAVRHWPQRCRVLVEGDSWFQYDGRFPFFYRTSNLFLSVYKRYPCVALCMSSNGDTVERMLGPRPSFDAPERVPPDHQRGAANLRKLRSRLDRHKKMHLLFFSGGGNDVVDNLEHMIVPFEPGITAEQALEKSQVNAQMLALRRGYEKLIRVRNEVSPDTLILTHNYGVPNLRKGPFRRWGFIRRGPWIKRGFAQRGYYADRSRPATEQEHSLTTGIIALLMHSFGEMLADLSAQPQSRLFVAETTDLLSSADWRDEMHLTRNGFDRAAKAFAQPLGAHAATCRG